MRTLAASIVETSKSILPLMAFLLAIIYLFGALSLKRFFRMTSTRIASPNKGPLTCIDVDS